MNDAIKEDDATCELCPAPATTSHKGFSVCEECEYDLRIGFAPSASEAPPAYWENETPAGLLDGEDDDADADE